MRAIVGWVASVSERGKMNVPARIRREVGLEHDEPVTVSVVDGEIRMRVLRRVLAELQVEAREVFVGSGETVDRFRLGCRDEARREAEEPA